MNKRCGCSDDTPVLVPVQTTKVIRSDTLGVVSTERKADYVVCCKCGTHLILPDVIDTGKLEKIIGVANKEN